MPRATIDIEPATLAILAKASFSGGVLKLPERLSRADYVAANTVLMALGGRWDKRMKGHTFGTRDAESLAEALQRAIETGTVTDTKKALEQFYTPTEVAVDMARWAVEPGDHVLEPSAGQGSLVFAALDAGALSVTAVEIDEANVVALRSLNDKRGGVDVRMGDFMEPVMPAVLKHNEPFDAVLMNPPFSRNQDIAHVRAAWNLLRPGGKLAAITSPHWTFAGEKACQDFGRWTQEIRAVCENLPEGTFKDAGTMVRTVLIRATK